MTLGKQFKRLRGEVKGLLKRTGPPGITSSPANSTISLPNVQTTSADMNPAPSSSVKDITTTVTITNPQSGVQLSPHSAHPASPSPIENQGGQTQSDNSMVRVQITSPSANPILDPTENDRSSLVRVLEHAIGSPASYPDPNPTPASLITAQEYSGKEEDASSAVDLTTGSTTAAHTLDTLSGSEATALENAPTRVWKGLSSLRGVLDRVPGGLGPLKPVLDDLSDVIGIYEDAAEAKQEYVALKNDLEALFAVLSDHFSGNVPPTMTAGMNNLCAAIEAELDKVSNKEERGVGRRYLEGNQDIQDVMKCYRRIQGHLERLKLNADLSMWKVVDEIAAENRLNSLAPSKAARYDSAESAQIGRRECTPETRKQVLAELSQWRHDNTKENMYWLNGMAGTGKTTIASSLCAMLDKSHELAASFFCSRLLPECRNINLILPTIAYQLATFSRPFYHALFLALQQDRDLHTKVLQSQFAGLIAGPLRQVAHALPSHLAVVIDALDECEDSRGVGQLLEILTFHASELPIKLFVSSRPEPQIRQKLGSTNAQLILHELENSIVKEDIKLYLHTELGPSVSKADLAALVERAGVLFIYAATVVRYIKMAISDSLRQRRIRGLLGTDSAGYSNKNKEIDALYATILAFALDNPELEDAERAVMKLVLHTVVCAREPLTTASLAGILAVEDAGLVEAALEPLWSVIHISGGDCVVTTLHASFSDYMLDPTRSNVWGCQRQEHHDLLAGLCFDRIENNRPHFNICALESSLLFDSEVSDLEARVRQRIPLDLSYACCYWAVHLSLGGYSERRANQLWAFLSKRLLLWMEVLNLKNKSSTSALILAEAREWCQVSGLSQEIKDLVHDAWRFAMTFATHDVMRSTPHIYVSMLASWPNPSPLADCYISPAERLISIRGTGNERRQLALLSTMPVGSSVEAVAFSRDGSHIVSGSYDKKIRLWDAATGRPTMDPLEGHDGSVNAVAFSPDGMHIVSGSSDNTIRVWHVTNGKPATDPLRGHTSSVLSVAFSPDGTRIVSGSDDKTIQLWNIASGKPLMDPLKEHTSSVNSVAFSTDSMCIVSGSSDNTIRVWDAKTGKPVMGPLKGHTKAVLSVAFSPDSRRIVSGSRDNTIRFWDVKTGQPVMDPLEGHTYPVNSVAFSPDGMQVVSGSYDYTIRLWDAETGKPVTDPLKGHTSLVYSVSFSPNGMYIISGSYDRTIRLWDTKTRNPVMGSLEGHTEAVYSVAFSPDRLRIVSSSSDRRVRLWDATTGKLVMNLFQADAPLAYSVAFTPDVTRIVSRLEGNTIHLWDAKTGELGMDQPKGLSESFLLAAFSPDGTRIVFNPQGNTLQVWDAITGKPVTDPLKGHTEAVLSIAFSPDSMHVVSGSEDNTIRLWDATTGKPVMAPIEGHAYPVNSVAFSPDGMRIVSGSDDCTVRVWDVTSGKPAMGQLEGHTHEVLSVEFSPDGMLIVSGSHDNTIRLWDATTGKPLMDPLEGHNSSVISAAFSPNGKHIVSGLRNNTIWLWDAITGKPVMNPLEGHTDAVLSVSFSPDGTRIVSGSYDNTIRVWDIGIQASQFQSRESLQAVNRSWTLDKNGWVRDGQQQPLLWLPVDLRHRLLRPQNTFLISTEGSVELDFEGAQIGESWTDCYIPA